MTDLEGDNSESDDSSTINVADMSAKQLKYYRRELRVTLDINPSYGLKGLMAWTALS